MNIQCSKIQHNVSLLNSNTMNLDAKAKDYFVLQSEDDCKVLYDIYKQLAEKDKNRKIFALGEGSNTVFASKEIDAFIVKVELNGYDIIKEDGDYVWVNCAAGELFRDFVIRCCKNNYSGLENLAAIYGTVGAAPVQNIGAYGSEVKDVIDKVRYFDLKDGQFYSFTAKECNFSYRNSVFKYQDGTKIITQVTFKLNKRFHFNSSYKALAQALADVPAGEINPMVVADKVTEIRNGKLPDPKQTGNCGSFFKNPVIEKKHYENLRQSYPDIVAFDDGEKKKISAGWLIEKCGFKGKRINNAGMHPKQALVLVNYGVENAKQLIDFAETVKQEVKDKFNIDLVAEPHIVY